MDIDMDVFVYGTLTDPECVRQIFDRFEYTGDASLDGLHPVEGRYLTLAPGGRVQGRILRIRGTKIDALDAYEGVDRGLYVRMTLSCADRAVEVYVGDPDRLDAPAEWPGNGPIRERVDRYLSTHNVRLRMEP